MTTNKTPEKGRTPKTVNATTSIYTGRPSAAPQTPEMSSSTSSFVYGTPVAGDSVIDDLLFRGWTFLEEHGYVLLLVLAVLYVLKGRFDDFQRRRRSASVNDPSRVRSLRQKREQALRLKEEEMIQSAKEYAEKKKRMEKERKKKKKSWADQQDSPGGGYRLGGFSSGSSYRPARRDVRPKGG
jgi:hypothetical protein